MTWTAIALLVGGLLLAAVVGGGYYLMNDGSLPASRQADYSATAVFKLTATKQAILQSLDQPAGSQTPSQSEPVLTSTLVPTNTLRPPL
jgi:hypothetical protein